MLLFPRINCPVVTIDVVPDIVTSERNVKSPAPEATERVFAVTDPLKITPPDWLAVIVIAVALTIPEIVTDC